MPNNASGSSRTKPCKKLCVDIMPQMARSFGNASPTKQPFKRRFQPVLRQKQLSVVTSSWQQHVYTSQTSKHRVSLCFKLHEGDTGHQGRRLLWACFWQQPCLTHPKILLNDDSDDFLRAPKTGLQQFPNAEHTLAMIAAVPGNRDSRQPSFGCVGNEARIAGPP